MKTKENIEQNDGTYGGYGVEHHDHENPGIVIWIILVAVFLIGGAIYCLVIYPIENIIWHKKELIEKGKVLEKISSLTVCWMVLYFALHVVGSFTKIGHIPLITTILMAYIPTWITSIFFSFLKPKIERISDIK